MALGLLAVFAVLLLAPWPASAQSPGQGSAPDVPDKPTGTAIHVGMVDLEWNEVPRADYYEVQLFYSSDWQDLPGNGVEIAFYGPGAILRNLPHEGRYYFRVRAGNSAGKSEWSGNLFMPATGIPSQWEDVPEPANVPATGTPEISGTARLDGTLVVTISGIEDGNGLERVKFSYQWISNDGTADTDIEGATDDSYTPVLGDVGNTVKVQVSFTDRGGYEESVVSAPTEVVVVENVPATGAPTIVGRLWANRTLAASVSDIVDANGLDGVHYSYQWISNDGTTDTDIEDATEATYTLRPDDEDNTIKVRVTFDDRHGNPESLTSAATEKVGPPDYHGDAMETATDLPLDTLVDGVFNGSDDTDFFKIELLEPTFFHAETYGPDHVWSALSQFTYLSGDGAEINYTGFGHRFEAGTYYIKVQRYDAYSAHGPELYRFQVKVIPDQGNAIETALQISLSDPATWGTLRNTSIVYGDFHSANDVDFFRLDLTSATEVRVYLNIGLVVTTYRTSSSRAGSGIQPLNLDLFDSEGTLVGSPREGFPPSADRTYQLDAGTHYFRLSPYADEIEHALRGYHLSVVATDGGEAAKGICGRTEHVRQAILYKLNDVSDCGTVTEAHLSSITSGLYLQDAVISQLKAEDFDGLTGLRALYLGHNSLSAFPDGVFDDLSDLEVLSLAHNDLTSLPDGVFDNLSTLRGLYLGNNDLGALPDGVFDNLTSLEVLSLVSNDLTSLPDGVFDNLSSLVALYLGNNGLTALPDGASSSLSSLEVLSFSGSGDAPSPFPRKTVTDLPGISGVARVGLTLSATTKNIRDEYGFNPNGHPPPNIVIGCCSPYDANGVDFSYQWLRGDETAETDIPGATNSTYTLVAADEGKTIKVRVTFTNIGHNVETLTSAATLPVIAESEDTGAGVCYRDVSVRQAILATLPEVGDCESVTDAHLSSITGRLYLSTNWISELSADDFRGLSNLEELHFGWAPNLTTLSAGAFNDLSSLRALHLEFSGLTSLPAGVFDNLSNLERLDLSYNIKLTSLPDGVFDELENLRTLNLDITGLTSLPDGVFDNLVNLQQLNLYRTNLTSLPAGVFDNLANLERLDLNNSSLTSLPDGVFDELSDLEYLDLSTNKIASLPNGAFADLSHLAELHLHRNELTSLPDDGFDGLHGLKILYLSYNNLTSLPNGIFDDLSSLEELSLDDNKLPSLPGGVFDNLSKLEDLVLGYNDLAALPDGIFDNLSSLVRLALYDNDLTSLPDGVFDNLSNLKELYMGYNDLTSLPDGVFDAVSNLRRLSLYSNDLNSLPDGVFTGLSSLEVLELDGNTGAPFVLEAELEQQDGDAVLVKIAEAAPFDLEVVLTAQGGVLSTMAATAATVEVNVAAGATSSEVVTVVPDEGHSEVTVTPQSPAFLSGVFGGIQPGVGTSYVITPVTSEQQRTATGLPTISGTPQVGQELTADVSGIADAFGLTNASYSYQWIRNDGNTDADIEDATGSSYLLTSSEQGQTVQVKVTFTDNADNQETLTSIPTAEVAALTIPPSTSAPAFATSTTSRSIAENSEAGTAVGRPVVATDTDDDTITYTLDGPDMTAFEIDDSGQIRVGEETVLDYESRETYTVEIVATDSSEETATITVTIMVTDVIDPNIVLIIADDVGYEVFGANGSTQYLTPQLDDLAGAGVRFTNAHSKPCCAPSRVALMTGKSNVRNYVDLGVLPRDQYLMVDLFREAGYATAIAGKWRLDRDDAIVEGVAGGAGFDTYCLWGTGNAGDNRYWNASPECDGQVTELESDEYGPDVFVNFLLEFIESNQNRPFFAYYPMVLSHPPFVAPPQSQCPGDDEQCIFEDMVAYMDGNVGRLHNKLAELELLDNTIVLFTSDNGTPHMMVSALNGETIYADKATTRDISTHVPLFVHVPGEAAGRVVDDLIDFTDFLPTLADAAGLTVPNAADLDGVSFWDRLQGKPGNPRKWLYTYYFKRPYASNFDSPIYHPEVAFARDKQYKLYDTGELFDVSIDPHELYPLPGDDEESSDARTKLQAALDSMPDKGQAILWSSVNGTTIDGRPRWRPVLSGARVTGDELTLTYAGYLDEAVRPPVDAFTVKVDGIEWTVSAVSINRTTVTLTLASPVIAGQTVTVSYTPGKKAIRHVNRHIGHKAVALTDVAVKNVTVPNHPATGAPTISGTPQVGQELTADVSSVADEDGLTNVSYSYQWVVNDGATDAEIEGATASTYTPSASDVGKTIKVQVSFTDDADNEETLTSEATDTVAATKPGAPGHLNVFPHDTGTLDVYWHAPASDGGSAITGYKVQWKETADSWNTEADVSEATVTGTTHTFTGLTDGVEYTVRVMAVNDVGEGAPSSEASGTPQEEPIWSATLTVGVAEDFAGYTIFLPNSNVLGALSSDTITLDDASYTVKALGVLDGKLILSVMPKLTAGFVLVLGTDEFASTDASTQEAESLLQFQWNDPGLDLPEGEEVAVRLTVPDDNSPATGLPTINGTPQVGVTLTAGVSGISDEDGLTNVSYRYQWIKSDGNTNADIEDATDSTYEASNDDLGQTIKVKVTFTDDDDNAETLTSVATVAVAAKPNSEPTSLPTISGTPQVEQTLTADTSAIADEDGLTNVSYSYQWIAGGSDIAGATGSSYTLTSSEQGQTVQVRVTFTDDADNAESLTSVATVAVAAKPNSEPTGLPTISGTPQVEQTLTADTSAIADEDGLTNVSYSYQWIAEGSDIAGATGSSYLLTTGEQGQTIQVKVNFTDDADNQESLTSAETLAVAAKPNTAATGEPTISGTPQVDETLTADTSAISDEDGLATVSYQYQWLRDDADIAGQTNSTYRLVSADQDKTIKVRVTFRDDADNAESLTSMATTAVAAQPTSPLTASFANVPADHDGSNFTFDLNFSENVNAGYARIRDDAFTVSGGTIARASRKTQGSNQGWTVEVDPTGNGAVSITLPETTDCDASGAICTDDSRKLSHPTSATVAGPSAISVSDATVQEAEGAVLVFTATLSHASSRTVTVDYATSDGTAVAGSDYTAASGTLTFNAGDTSQTVQVTVLTDSEDESQETLTLTLSNPSQATLDDGTGTGTIENGESSSGTQEDPLAEDPPAETPVVLLTASFGNMPATHNGSAFTFDLTFSEEFGISYVTLRDDAFSVTDGEVTSARRLTQGSNIGWTITVTPDSAADVTIVLPVTTDCDADGAVCTADGRKLSNRLEFTVSGPSG